jgi:hypothetical protein
MWGRGPAQRKQIKIKNKLDGEKIKKQSTKILCKKPAKLVGANLGRMISSEIREPHLVASLQSGWLPWWQTQ